MIRIRTEMLLSSFFWTFTLNVVSEALQYHHDEEYQNQYTEPDDSQKVQRRVWSLRALVVADALILLFGCLDAFVSQESFVACRSEHWIRRCRIVASESGVRVRSFNNVGGVTVLSPVTAVETDCGSFAGCVVRSVVALSIVPDDRVAAGASCNARVLQLVLARPAPSE